MGVTGKKILIPVILISVILIVAVCIFGGSTIGNNQGSNTRPNGFVSTENQAVEIALPLAQTYAQENNRTTTTLTSTCYLDTRPSWDVIINFEVIETEKGEPISEQCGISGYYIGIWADTGEIRTHSVINLAGFLGRETDTVGNPALETTNRLVLAV